jgi:hypothetical protein
MQRTVFLDTNVFKFSATSLRRYVGRKETLQWGPLEIESVLHSEQLVNPNEGIQNERLKKEATLLPAVAATGIGGQLRFVISAEARYEQWGLPNLDSETGMFYGASVSTVDAPIEYGRVMGGLGIDGPVEQTRFLTSLSNPRFVELQKATGAFQGDKPRNRNQLLDAFHLWCAEHNACDFFLTLDFKLIRVLARSKKEVAVRVVTPSELLHAVESEAQ